jgi:hypothetical protein
LERGTPTKWPIRPQLKQTLLEMAPAMVVVVEPLVLPTDVDADVGEKLTAGADAGADADEAGR